MRLLLSHITLGLALVSASAFAQEVKAPAGTAPAPPATEQAPSPETAAPAVEEHVAAAPATDAAAGTAPTSAGKIGAPPEGKGQIVFFREKKFAGSAIRYKVREGQTELGKLSSGAYFVLPVEPGTHEYVVHSEAKDVLTLEVEPGETYYVQGTVTMGFLAGHPNLSPSDQATFERVSAKLTLAK